MPYTGAERQARYLAKHPEKVKATNARYRAANREKLNAAATRWYAKNPERVKAYVARYRAENSDKVKAARARWRTENPEYGASWRAENSDIVAATASIGNAGRRYPDCLCEGITWRDVLSFYTEARRLTRETGEPHEVDHIIALANGGLHRPDNLQVLTKAENLLKGNS